MVMVKSRVFNELGLNAWRRSSHVHPIGGDTPPPLETRSTRACARSKMKHGKHPPVMAMLCAKALLMLTMDHSFYGFHLCLMALLRLSEEGRCYVLLRL